MSNDSEFLVNTDETISPSKIRSRNKRRILGFLAEGRFTVSEIASATGIRVPHASAEIRRLRNATLVDSDMPAGSRGAKLHLTESGWLAIKSDELALASEAIPISREHGDYCILFRDGPNLLLGLLVQPSSPLIPIPDRPPPEIEMKQFSSGTEGVPWSWAVLKERSPRWIDLLSNEYRASPPAYDKEKIETFTESESGIGIVRAKLLDEERPIAIAPGKWFSGPIHRPKPPLPEASMHRGQWVLARCHEMAPDIRPASPIIAVVSERLPRSMLLKASRNGSLIIADLSGFESEGDKYPIESLEHWVSVAHPRLSESERSRRCQALKDRVLGTRRVRTEDSTWRRFRQDWGKSEFSSSEIIPRLLDTRGLGKAASESLTRWAISTEGVPPLVIDIPKDTSKDLLNLVSSSKNLRMALVEKRLQSFSNIDTLTIDPLRPLPWMSLRTTGGKDMPVRIVDPVLHSPDPHDISLTGKKNDHIMSKLKSSVSTIEDQEYMSIIKSAISQYPEGNEDWANRMEARYPIASWIASTPRSRWPRWQRLSSRLDPEWLSILDFNFLPLEGLSEVADVAPQSVLDVFSTEFTRLLRSDHNSALRSRPTIDSMNATRGSSWVASQLLANSAWLPESLHGDLLDWALEVWLANPPTRSVKTLQGLLWLISSDDNFREERTREILEKILSRADELPFGHDIRTWSTLNLLIVRKEEPTIENVEQIINTLPLEWWAHISSDLLEWALQEDKIFSWLIERNISWPAAILRPIGTKSEFPFKSDLQYDGCGPKIRGLLSRRFRVKEEIPEEAESLIDLLESLDAINENRPPRIGKTHPLVGWLGQPIYKWPNFTINSIIRGDKNVVERLLLKSSGFHEGLLSKATFE